MSVVWNPSAGSTSEPAEAQAAQSTLAIAVVFATVLFNLMLCFVNTTLFGIGTNRCCCLRNCIDRSSVRHDLVPQLHLVCDSIDVDGLFFHCDAHTLRL